MSHHHALSVLLNTLSSSKLALVLIVLLILFSLAGVILPQQGKLQPEEIEQWQKAHPAITGMLRPMGLFHVFHSWPFLAIIFFLGVNTLICTVLHFFKEGGLSAFKGPKAIEKTGFIFLHLSLIVLFSGGICSAALKLDGRIVLTEGQSFTEQHKGYLRLVEGPLRPEHHKQFVVVLKDVRIEYEREQYLANVTSNLEFFLQADKVSSGVIKINKPYKYRGLTFTQDQTGFSPRIVIEEKNTEKVLVNSFIALKTFQTSQGAEYRDFLPLPFLENKVIITLHPGLAMDDDLTENIGEESQKPFLLVETEDESGQVISQTHLQIGKKVVIGKYSLGFTGLRRWASFRVTDDPGYPIVLFSLWMGIVTLLLRYVPDLWKWLKPEASTKI